EKVINLFQEQKVEDALDSLKSLIGENTGISEIEEYFEALSAFKNKDLKVALDLSLARGLSYYTGIIFEVKPTSVKMGSICGGGRYDDLTGIFGLKEMSGVGISFGLDRIYDVMEELSLFPEKVGRTVDVLVVHFSKENQKHGQHLVTELRSQGVCAELYPDQVKIQKQFNYADKINTPYTLIIGDDEMNSETYSLKDMSSGQQEKLTLSELKNRSWS
ncbi:MAG: His/Gly/Thr/Pro-type tRNA ligase C-terminal domain-containing protein, partial [Bacteroidota bacterium]